MDGHRFDDIARTLAGGASRRSVLKGLVGGLAGMVALRATQTSAQTACDTSDDCGDDQFCCRGACYAFGLTICHRTASDTNPYTTITISNDGLSGHCDHAEDLILAPGGVCPTCIAESLDTTCANIACGSTTNNCGDTVECPSTCGACETCGDNNTCVSAGNVCGESCCNGSQQCCNDVCIATDACCSDTDCGNCETCDDTHTCVAGGESCGQVCCDAGQQCCDGACIAGDACCEDSDCGACETCGNDHTCATSGISCGDACCDPATQQCCNGGCIDKNACCTDDDCPGNQTCHNGQCVAQCVVDGGTCSGEDDCCEGSTCACGVCRSGQITICHATGNTDDPYDEITIDVTELNDHCGDTGDLIPAPDAGCPQTVCTPESNAKTCGSDKCGTKQNNCGQSVVCGSCGSNETCQNGACVSSGGPSTSNGGTTPSKPTEVTALPATGIGQNAGASRNGWMGPLAVIGGGAALLANRLRKGTEQTEQQ